MEATEIQNQIIRSNDPNIYVAAGPGSGKTTTTISRIFRLIDEGCPPAWIVCITFTNAAAREIETRLWTRDAKIKLGYAGTIHGFCLREIQRNPTAAEYLPGLTVIDQEQAGELLAEILAEHKWKGSADDAAEAIKAGPFIPGTSSPLDLIRHDYYQKLKRANAMDFDSILFYALAMFRKLTLREMPYRHLMVDEVQDSSGLDWQIYTALPMPFKYWVGDYDQSVYAFRGARPQIMVAQMSAAKGFKAVLHINFRSDKEICRAATNLIRYNTERIDKPTTPASGNLGAVELFSYRSPILEMNATAGKIAQAAGSVAVLLRTNALVGEWASFLEGVGIDVARRIKPKLPKDWRTCRALLAMLANPDNDEAAFRYLKAAYDVKHANAQKLKALAAYTSINEVSTMFPPQVAIRSLPEYLNRAAISPESAEVISRAVEMLDDPNTATIADLILVLNQAEAMEREQGKGVTVCTIHGAKGLEFDDVYLPAFEQGIIPASRGEIEEERRLAFVAITRARHRVIISHCDNRKREWQASTEARPSQFINELKGRM